jgi:hypothetical protein
LSCKDEWLLLSQPNSAAEPVNMEEIVEALAHYPILSMVDEENA